MHLALVVLSIVLVVMTGCTGEEKAPPLQEPAPAPEPESTPSTPEPQPEPEPEPPADPAFAEELADEAAPPAVTALRAAIAPSNGAGCAPGARCIRVSQNGKPSSSGASIAQCRGQLADFIVARTTVPASYTGPWFQPNLIETAHTGIPQTKRPWRNFDPRKADERMKYVLALRNYAFSSAVVRGLTPELTANGDYEDALGGSVVQDQRGQRWYPAPRMIYGSTTTFGVREAAHGMTRERATQVGTLGDNTARFDNFAVGYYDARGARTFARTWKTTTSGTDSLDTTKMTFTKDALVFKLLYSAAKPTDFPTDILEGSQEVKIIPTPGGQPISVRLLQIDIAVKDERAGVTGWYFATYAFDRSIAGSSPWLKMAPVGLMWGNDPGGLPLKESWINPATPAYAAAHLGFEGRLNGPVDNPASACMSCHSTAQVPTLANMLATGSCTSKKAEWFRNISGSTAFGRFDQNTPGCDTEVQGPAPIAADYSLQLSDTATKALTGPAEFNPCTWDTEAPAPAAAPARAARVPARGTVFEVAR